MAEVEADANRDDPGTDALIGTIVSGRFHIVKRIARGGMGSVYFATQAPLSRPVVVKVLHVVRNIDAESEEKYRRRFLLEASILAKLQHPNIVTLLDYGQIADLPGEHYFIAMEYLRGENLAQRFRTRGRLTIAESVRLAWQIGRGLREAHRCGFIHRDMKPSNIMLVPEDEKNDIVKLIDFGIGKIIPGRTEHLRDGDDVTRAGLLLGSPRYMSPEQIRSEPVEPRTDLYGLGVIFFQALTGRLPFDGGTQFDVMVSHCFVPPPELSVACPDVFYPESLSQLVRALLQKQVTSRPTVDEFLQRLASVEEEIFGTISLTGSPLQTTSPTTPVGREALGASDIGASHLMSQPVWAARSEPPPGMDTSPPSLSAFSTQGRRRTTVVAVLLALVAAVAIFLLIGHFLLDGTRVTVKKMVDVQGGGIAVGAPVPELAASGAHPVRTPVEPEVRVFPLTIDSSPPGATVMENGKALGVTPVTISVDRKSVSTAPRIFVLQRDGYAPFTIEQGDSESPVRKSAALVVGSRQNVAAWRASQRAATSPANPVSPTNNVTPSDGPRLDIRLRR